MTGNKFKVLGAVLLLGLMSTANAASLVLIYTGSNDVDANRNISAVAGDVLTFDIIMDFSDVTTIGGGFDVNFDSSVLIFDSLVNNNLGEADFGRDPDIQDGLLNSWAFAAFVPIGGPDLVGSVSFIVADAATRGGNFDIFLSATSGIGGPFVSGQDFITLLDVDYGQGYGVRPIPVPAAVWFMLSGLGALLGFGRKSA